MDDILVHGSTPQEHDERLQKVLSTIQKSGLKLNKDKCKLRQTDLNFLGHHIDGDGVRPSEEKVMAIKALQPPRNITELKRCLGMINYLGRFIENLAEALKPLNDLLRSDVTWTWGPNQDFFL